MKNSFKINKKIFKFLFSICILLASTNAFSENLFFTYAGVAFGGGINKIDYNYWENDVYENKTISGNYYNGGIIFNIFVNNIVGEFTLNPQYEANDSETSLYHLNISTIGKYNYSFSDSFSVTAGLGIYLDTPPYTKKYKGSGFTTTFGFIYTPNWDWKIIYDFTMSIGTFETDYESDKMSFGAKIGFLRKFGRI